MKSLKFIAFAIVLTVSAAQVSFAKTGIIISGRSGIIISGRTGQIPTSRTITPQTTEGIIPTQNYRPFRSSVHDEMFFGLLFWLNSSVW